MGRHALLLGTATFHADLTLAALPAVRHDIGQLKALFDDVGAFDSVDVYVDLDRVRLTAVVENFFGVRRVGDLALLYYSGHGRVPSTSGLRAVGTGPCQRVVTVPLTFC